MNKTITNIWTFSWQIAVCLIMLPVLVVVMAISMGQGRPGPHMKCGFGKRRGVGA